MDIYIVQKPVVKHLYPVDAHQYVSNKKYLHKEYVQRSTESGGNIAASQQELYCT